MAVDGTYVSDTLCLRCDRDRGNLGTSRPEASLAPMLKETIMSWSSQLQ